MRTSRPIRNGDQARKDFKSCSRELNLFWTLHEFRFDVKGLQKHTLLLCNAQTQGYGSYRKDCANVTAAFHARVVREHPHTVTLAFKDPILGSALDLGGPEA